VRQYEKSKKTGDFLEFYNKVNQIANSSGKFKKTVKMIGMVNFKIKKKRTRLQFFIRNFAKKKTNNRVSRLTD